MGNVEVIPRGGVQFTSAGSGISHSEYNHSHTKPVHFLQMWVSPNQQDLDPAYETRIFSDEEKLNKVRIISQAHNVVLTILLYSCVR